MMNILVTGGTGFIGKWLVDELVNSQQHRVTLLVRKGNKDYQSNEDIIVHEVDFAKDELGEYFFGQDVCIHLIGKLGGYGVNKEEFDFVNIELTKKILDICIVNKIKQFIYCSTPGVQGFGHRLAAEEDEYNPRNDYERTKMVAEKLVIDRCTHEKFIYTIIRPDFVYGPGDDRRVKLYKNIQNKKFILTTKGDSYMTPTYITDVAQGIIKAIDNTSAYNQIFNLSADQEVTVLEYLNTIAQCTDSKLIHINIGYFLSSLLAGMIERIYSVLFHKEAFVTKNKIDFLAIDHSVSCAKAKRLLGYCPKVSLQEGMLETIAWCKKNNLL